MSRMRGGVEVEDRAAIGSVLRLPVFEAAHLLPRLRPHGVGVRPVDLDQVAAGVANVELDLPAWQFVEVVAHRVAVVDAAFPRQSKDRVEVVHREGEVVIHGRASRSLEEVQLEVADSQPLHWEAEVRGVDLLGTEKLDIEARRLLEVVGANADVVDAACGHDHQHSRMADKPALRDAITCG